MTMKNHPGMPVESGYIPVNGLKMYYEIHGKGEPLILLHGGVGAIEMFGEVLPMLAAGRQVIAADLQAHGRTVDIDRNDLGHRSCVAIGFDRLEPRFVYHLSIRNCQLAQLDLPVAAGCIESAIGQV